MKQSNKQTAIYCRIASSDDISIGIDDQRFQLMEYAKEQGHDNLTCYVDIDHSGFTFDRPAFIEMERAIYEGRVAVVLVTDVSRIGQDYTEVMRWAMRMEDQGIEIIAVDNLGFPDTMFSLDALLHVSLKGGEQ